MRAVVVLLLLAVPCLAQPPGQDRDRWIAKVEREISLMRPADKQTAQEMWPNIKDDKFVWEKARVDESRLVARRSDLFLTTDIRKQVIELADRDGSKEFCTNTGITDSTQAETVRLRFGLKDAVTRMALKEIGRKMRNKQDVSAEADFISRHRDVFPTPK